MKNIGWSRTLGWILLTEAVGALAAWLTRDGLAAYQTAVQRPPLTPPDAWFPVVWGILYALMGFGAARIARSAPSPARSTALGSFARQLAVNFLWSLIFFNRQAYLAAFVLAAVLWGLLVRMIRDFARVDPAAARLQIPYLLWVGFAVYLSGGVWLANRG